MSLFGIKKAIELAERELNNIEFSNSKEDIRKHGSNVFIMLERVIVELIYVYGYLLYKDNYKEKLAPVVNLKKHVMLGTALHALKSMNKILNNAYERELIQNYFNRDYIVFQDDDIFYDKLMECSRIRGKILHDNILDIDNLHDYRLENQRGMKLAYEALSHFKEKNIFPNIIEKESIKIENNDCLIIFKDEIGSIIPIKSTKRDVELFKDSKWYIFRMDNIKELIPVNMKINHLENNSIEKSYMDFKVSVCNNLHYLEFSDRDRRFYIDKEDVYIGRADYNDVRFENRSISRSHCVIKNIEGYMYISDLGSKFGTIVNNSRIMPQEEFLLQSDDEIFIGKGIETVKIIYKIRSDKK